MALFEADDIEAVIRRNVGMVGLPHLEVIGVGADSADIRVRYDERMNRLGGTISGPVLMAAADAAMYAAIIAHVPNGEYAVTSHLNVDFLKRPGAADLHARARLLRVGGRSVSGRVELYSGGFDTLVAHVTGAYARMTSATSGAGRS